MTINPYFSDYEGEQNLNEDINIELIQCMGRNVKYVPKTINDLDKLFGEDMQMAFNGAYEIEVYVDMPEGPEGGDIVTQFGIQIQQRIRVRMAIKRFNEAIGAYTGLTRPLEGDLIYFPLSKTLYEINKVQHLNPFYPFGKIWCYDLTLEVFTYSHEKINTGDSNIDEVYETNYQTVKNFQVGTGTGTFYPGQFVYQTNAGNTLFQGNVLAWTPGSSLLEVGSITGSPSTLYSVFGATTTAYTSQPSYTVTVVNDSFTKLPVGADKNVPDGDNDAIEEERFQDDILPYDDQNPFSEEDE